MVDACQKREGFVRAEVKTERDSSRRAKHILIDGKQGKEELQYSGEKVPELVCITNKG